MQALEASCGLTPAEDNLYCAHALPLQAARQLKQERRPAAAALAYEAAARVRPQCAAVLPATLRTHYVLKVVMLLAPLVTVSRLSTVRMYG